MCLHLRHFPIYDTLTCDSYQKHPPFWHQKSSRIEPQAYKIRSCFFTGFVVRFLFDLGAHLGPFWPPKQLQDAAQAMDQCRPEPL